MLKTVLLIITIKLLRNVVLRIFQKAIYGWFNVICIRGVAQRLMKLNIYLHHLYLQSLFWFKVLLINLYYRIIHIVLTYTDTTSTMLSYFKYCYFWQLLSHSSTVKFKNKEFQRPYKSMSKRESNTVHSMLKVYKLNRNLI